MIAPVVVDGFVLLIGVVLMGVSFVIGYVHGYKVATKKSTNRWRTLSRIK